MTELIPMKEAARRLGVSERTLRSHVKGGDIRYALARLEAQITVVRESPAPKALETKG